MAGQGGDHTQAFANALRGLYEAAGQPPSSVLTHQAAVQRPPIKLTDSSISDWLNGAQLGLCQTAGLSIRMVSDQERGH